MSQDPSKPEPRMSTPTGLGRRQQRLSDEETARRMLEAAVAAVNTTGLTVSLDHISLEELIRDAGVSRSSAYRRWPYKDLFLSDLLKELARATSAAVLTEGEWIGGSNWRVAREHLDWLETPELRHELLLELFRQGALLDFEARHERVRAGGSTEWRTYIALHATFLSLPEGDLRDEVQAALAQSERSFISRVAAGWAYWAELLGYRLRPELGVTFETVATLANTMLRGLLITALSTPEVATRQVEAAPFGASAAAGWSPVSLGIASIAVGFLEPDPTVTWDAERLADVRRRLASENTPSSPIA